MCICFVHIADQLFVMIGCEIGYDPEINVINKENKRTQE